MMPPEDIEADLTAEEQPATAPMTMTEICVPSTSLEVGDDSEMAAPEVGQSVDFTGSGKVTRVEGGNIYLELVTVNGEPLGPKASPDAPLNEEEQLDADVMASREPEFS